MQRSAMSQFVTKTESLKKENVKLKQSIVQFKEQLNSANRTINQKEQLSTNFQTQLELVLREQEKLTQQMVQKEQEIVNMQRQAQQSPDTQSLQNRLQYEDYRLFEFLVEKEVTQEYKMF